MVIPISMILAQYQYRHFLTFLWKRSLRIEPPYLVSMLIGMVYLYVRNFIPSSTPVDLFPTWNEILLHVGYLIPFFEDARWINAGYWTLAIEFQYYISLAIIFPLALSTQTWKRIVFYCILLALPFVYNSGHCFTGWGSYFLLGLVYILFQANSSPGIRHRITARVCCHLYAARFMGSMHCLGHHRIGLLFSRLGE
jgi:peptidoglycan/LPS O-acetylase OafA/YrhL